MKIIYKETYVAKDNTIFDYKDTCLIYEKYCDNNFHNILKDYLVYNEKVKKEFENNTIPKDFYVVVYKPVPAELEIYFNTLRDTGKIKYSPIPCTACFEPRLYYCYDGKWKFNGTITSLKRNMENIQTDIKTIEELMKRT